MCRFSINVTPFRVLVRKYSRHNTNPSLLCEKTCMTVILVMLRCRYHVSAENMAPAARPLIVLPGIRLKVQHFHSTERFAPEFLWQSRLIVGENEQKTSSPVSELICGAIEIPFIYVNIYNISQTQDIWIFFSYNFYWAHQIHAFVYFFFLDKTLSYCIIIADLTMVVQYLQNVSLWWGFSCYKQTICFFWSIGI